MTPKFTRVSTGIKELDNILNGGLPIPSVLLIIGDVGTGKSVLCQHILYHQANEGFKCTYLCIDRPPLDVKLNMRSMGIDPTNLEERGLIKFVDLFIGKEESSKGVYLCNPRDFDDLVSTVRKLVLESEHHVFVLDSISSIAFLQGERKAYDFIQRFHGWIWDVEGVGIVNAVRGGHSQFFEVAIQHALENTISLRREDNGNVCIEVTKTTRTSHKKGKFRLDIDETGVRIKFYSTIC